MIIIYDIQQYVHNLLTVHYCENMFVKIFKFKIFPIVPPFNCHFHTADCCPQKKATEDGVWFKYVGQLVTFTQTCYLTYYLIYTQSF